VIRHMRMGCSYGLGLAKQRLGLFLSSLRG
jgi:hypothetical protein